MPTVAVENVWIALNSSVIHDEVLAHRVGLVPIRVDPSKLDYVIGGEETDRDTIVFHFDVECKVVDNKVVNESAFKAISPLYAVNATRLVPPRCPCRPTFRALTMRHIHLAP
ncbi:hypothetical protein EON65_53565 [archaeon]|nr:MAG: hypothetical protein EON65_53565 [archaeon]